MEFQKKNTPEVVFFLYKIVDVVGKQWLCRTTAIIFIVFVASLILAIIHPIAGEAWVYNLTVISGILTAGLVGMLAAVGIGTAVNLGTILISVGVKEAKALNGTKALPAGDMFSIHPDILIWQRLDETQSQFEDRINSAVKNRGSAWIAVIAYQDIYIRVQDFSPEGFWTHRSDETLHLPQYAESVFVDETEQDYHKYLHDVCPRIRSAFMEKKTKKSKNALQPLMQQSLNVLIFLLLSVSLFSQTNTDKVKSALSGNDFKPTEGEYIHYVFSDGSSVTRPVNKNRTISETFSAGYIGADNIQRGEVVGIDIDRKPVDIRVTIPATGTTSQPQPLFKTRMEAPHNETVPQKSFSESLPDSATVANGVNQIIQEGDSIKAKLWKSIQPAWILAMWFFDSIFFILIGGGGVFWYYAKTARQNGNLGYTVLKIQRWASRNVLYVCWIITTVVLINTFLHLIYMDWPIWSVMVVWGFILWIALYLTNKVTPNGEEVYFKDGFTEYRQLGGGDNQYKKR